MPPAPRTKAMLDSILDYLPNPVFVKDARHRWVLLNDAYCRFMGHPREVLLGKSDYDFFPAAEADVFWRRDDLVLAGGGVNENEEGFTDASGRAHVLVTRKKLHVDEQGRRFVVGVITDITERKRAEDELRRSRDELDARVDERTRQLQDANERLREQDREKTAFLHALSHELRNPLAPIQNALWLLQHAPADPTAADRAASVISRQVHHLTRIVDDLLDVARLSRGKAQLQRARVDLARIVAQTADDYRPLFVSRGVALEIRAVGPVWLLGDETRLGQIVANLLTNAAKFTDSGGRVDVSVEGDRSAATLRVADTGIGIAPEMVGRVFDAFVQADPSIDRRSGGLGLGLSLVRALAELHGGTVEARSSGAGRGAEFLVRLPVAEGAAPEPEPPRASRPARARRVLVVEDNVDAAETLREMMELDGHEVAVAYDGAAGVAKAREFHPDVVLCDIGLPELDGYGVARAIRADPELATAYLVALTGYALPEDQRRAADAGFSRHVAKPAPADLIQELVATAPVVR